MDLFTFHDFMEQAQSYLYHLTQSTRHIQKNLINNILFDNENILNCSSD